MSDLNRREFVALSVVGACAACAGSAGPAQAEPSSQQAPAANAGRKFLGTPTGRRIKPARVASGHCFPPTGMA